MQQYSVSAPLRKLPRSTLQPAAHATLAAFTPATRCSLQPCSLAASSFAACTHADSKCGRRHWPKAFKFFGLGVVGRKTHPIGGALRSPPIGWMLRVAGAAQTPKVDDSRSAPKYPQNMKMAMSTGKASTNTNEVGF